MQYEINKSITNQLKGIGIIFVILGHLCLLDVIKLPSNKFEYAGAWGVTIFLILSGYGLTQSYFKSGINLTFIYKRISKVGLPYIIITLVWILIDRLFFKINHDAIVIFKSLLGFDFKYSIDPTMWYITYIVMWYIIFFLIFILPMKDIFKIILFIAVYIFMKISSFNLIYDWHLYTEAFPIGVLFAYLLSKSSKLNINISRQIFFVLTTVILFRVFLYFLFEVNNFTAYNKLSISSIFLVFSILSFLILVGYQSKILSFLGSISYELYLIEGKILFVYGIPKISDVLWIKLFDYVTTILLSAFILKLTVRLIKKVNKQ
jgi:peptidoglycan/LPS O-acetylase OafA/YrhL